MDTVRPGELLAGKYRVERVLGSGGMGYVVAARHIQLDQLVAMKFLRRSETLDESEASGRFLREAKAVVRLRDEHVAKVYDVGTLDNGDPFIVMEYLEGGDLAAIAKQRGLLSVHEAVEYTMQACEGLAEAHSLGIVHRDVKLANLFVTRGPTGAPLVKVLDFGISKVNPFGESEQEMTRTAAMLGSPRFMSPEQMRDPRAVDARSDLWSLGVVLYRLVAGKPPFEADTLGRLLTMVMHETPPHLSTVRADLPPGFADVVMKCLEKEPSARFANVAELSMALVPFAGEGIRARSSADRAALTLNVVPAPPSFISVDGADVPSAASSRPSLPGASDTGTAAPWAGPQSGGTPREGGSRASVIGAAIALAAVLGAGALFAKVQHDQTVTHRAAAAPLAAAPLAAPTMDTSVTSSTAQPRPDDTSQAPSVPVDALPEAYGYLPPMPATGVAPAPSPPAHDGHDAHDTKAVDHRRPATPGGRKIRGAAPAERAPTSPSTPKDNGIPSTRN